MKATDWKSVESGSKPGQSIILSNERKYEEKRGSNLLSITKQEAEYLMNSGWPKMVKHTVSGRKRKYFVVENPKCLRVLDSYRKRHVIKTVLS